MAASVAKDDVIRCADKPLATPRCGAALARNDMLRAHYGAGWTARLRLHAALEILTEAEVARETVARGFFLPGLLLIAGAGLARRRVRRRVILRAFFRIRKDGIGVEELAEFFRGPRVARITVRMVTKNHLAVGAFDFVR